MQRSLASGCLWLAAMLPCLCTSCGATEPASPGKDGAMERQAMVDQIKAYGVRDADILAAMLKVRRDRFIPASILDGCDPYGDHPCPIGYGQTISQPYIVAYMTEKMDPQPGERFLEVGTGSGYQAAILAELGAEVFSIEIIPELAEHARNVLTAEGYAGVKVLAGDGYKGWPEHAPFDSVIVTCAADELPQALVEQLKEGGRMILPLGDTFQHLVILRKRHGKIVQEKDIPVRFVPMVHGHEK